MPSACCTRYSISYSPRVWSACLIAPSRAVRSSGCTRSKVAAKSRRASGSRPNSERPRSVIHTSLPETSHTHMARFPASAARPIRFALSRNASFERLSSSMTTASSISGVAVTRRNSCSASRILGGGLGQERAVPAHGSPDRLERNDQHRDADSTKAEAERRPDEQRNRRI